MIKNSLKNFVVNEISEKTYKDVSQLKNSNRSGPFSLIEVMNSIQNSLIISNGFKSRILPYAVKDRDSQILAIGLFFEIEIDNIKILLSGGRFGYSQTQIFSSHVRESDLLDCFENFCIDKDISICSIALNFNESTNGKNNSLWDLRNVSYLMANISETCLNGELNFPAALKRTSLSRGIKLAKKNNVQSCITSSKKLLEQWYFSCHLPRMKELDGKIWPLDIFNELVDSNYGGLCIASNKESNDILGGCLYVKNNNIMELFMMSSIKMNQKLGVNYSISERLYQYASELNIEWLNWQSSNPPNGPLVEFKKKWNSKSYNFNIYSKIFRENVRFDILRSKIKDFFIYPEI